MYFDMLNIFYISCMIYNSFLMLQAWTEGSLEETVQNAKKSWEMELSHKTCLQDFRSINPDKFKLIVNGNRFFLS